MAGVERKRCRHVLRQVGKMAEPRLYSGTFLLYVNVVSRDHCVIVISRLAARP
jgi:hypothetical protein